MYNPNNYYQCKWLYIAVCCFPQTFIMGSVQNSMRAIAKITINIIRGFSERIWIIKIWTWLQWSPSFGFGNICKIRHGWLDCTTEVFGAVSSFPPRRNMLDWNRLISRLYILQTNKGKKRSEKSELMKESRKQLIFGGGKMIVTCAWASEGFFPWVGSRGFS